jgi:hypothetical protein
MRVANRRALLALSRWSRGGFSRRWAPTPSGPGSATPGTSLRVSAPSRQRRPDRASARSDGPARSSRGARNGSCCGSRSATSSASRST